ncbi:MAG: ATP-grasp domain-containing protein, partial [Chloroflexi bacterium]|nr:ATP-grasp domain-containing protein [Chloroflexota bacterium]
MFSKILVANRGEIAVRVQQTLQAMGIATVAVYSDPDTQAPHVRMADEAYPLGGDTAGDTYLDIDKLLHAARISGADAVHPGYGFLSENPDFAQACGDAGLVFIGPSPENMALLGDKVRAKDAARNAAVPTVPSSPVLGGNVAAAGEFIESVGLPVMVKAAAGGGGRGLRLVNDAEQLPGILEIAAREAQSAFGDGRVFLEKYVERSRHIEFQVAADGHGNVIHLLERECSIQRRHQKIIEETPAQALSPELRKRMGEAAVMLTRQTGYLNLGTVEFLLDDADQFYFLEMNAR